MQMTVKSVSAVGVLCEWSNAVKRGELTVSPQSLEQMTMLAPSAATAEGPPRGLPFDRCGEPLSRAAARHGRHREYHFAHRIQSGHCLVVD